MAVSRNTDNHFGLAPTKSIGRSSFRKPFSHKTTFNTGDIVPIYTEEVLPGDTIKVHTASLVRMTTPINPVMDNAWMDTYFYFAYKESLTNMNILCLQKYLFEFFSILHQHTLTHLH